MTPPKIFVDSDVVISSLLSKSGAAYFLINQTTGVELCISILSMLEIKIVAQRLRIAENPQNSLESYLLKTFVIIDINKSEDEIKKIYKPYVRDVNDAHIVAGLVKAKADFLISYNIKDFKAEKIKQDFSAILLTPAHMLQYLRSLK